MVKQFYQFLKHINLKSYFHKTIEDNIFHNDIDIIRHSPIACCL